MIDLTLLLWIVIVLAYIGLCYLVGRLALDTLVQPAPPLMVAGAALIGATLLALQLWLYGAVRIPWNALTLLLPWVLIAAVRRHRIRPLVREEQQRAIRLTQVLSTLNVLEWILVVAGTIVVLACLLSLVAQPLMGWDAIGAWLFKAKLFYTQQAVDLRAVSGDATAAWAGSSITLSRAPDYPPLFSLIAATLYTLLGQAVDVLGKAVTFIFVLTAAAVSLTALSRWLNRQLAITFTFLLVALPLFWPALLTSPYMGYADYPVGVCMMLSLLYFHDAETRQNDLSYLFVVVFAAMAALIKNEGLVFLAILLPLLATHLVSSGRLRRLARSDWPILAALLLTIGPVLAWRAYLQLAGLTPQGGAGPDLAQYLPLVPSRASTILGYLGSLPSLTRISTGVASVPMSYGDLPLLGISFLLSGVLLGANRFRAGLIPYLAIGLQAVAYFVFFLFTPVDLTFYLSGSVDRLVIQLAPSVILILAIALRPHLSKRTVDGVRPRLAERPVEMKLSAVGEGAVPA